METIVISVGTELITGETTDTNAGWLSHRLTALGARVRRHVAVGDRVDPLAVELARALRESETVVVTGGLGPTPDDITRDAIALALHEPIEVDPEALDRIEAFFRRIQRTMSPSDRRQAMIPRGCHAIPNDRGTAPGIYYRGAGCRLFALPGVPAEMKAMYESAVAPVLRTSSNRAASLSASLRCFGISEAKLGELLADLMDRDRNPHVGTTVSEAVLTVRILARADHADEAKRMLADDVADIRRRLGTAIFGEGEESLQDAVAQLLVDGGKTVATAESCTGGWVAKRLTDVPGSSAYFTRGYVAYADDAKIALLNVPERVLAEHGAVSEETARAMALGCRQAAGTDMALSVTGIAGPGGACDPDKPADEPADKPVGLVYFGLADAEGHVVRRVLFGDHLTRREIRDRSCKTALNMLRLRLLGALAP